MNLIKQAEEIARRAHGNQLDKGGNNFFSHPEAVANLVNKKDEKAVAYLHDVLEYTPLTVTDLKKAQLPEKVITAVVALTREQSEDLFTYIERIKRNDLAKRVKIASIQHNLDLSRIPQPTTDDFLRVEKYHLALRMLQDEA